MYTKYSLHIGITNKFYIYNGSINTGKVLKLCRYIHFLPNPHHGGEQQYSPDFGSLG